VFDCKLLRCNYLECVTCCCMGTGSQNHPRSKVYIVRMKTLALVGLAIGSLAAPASGQVTTLDEGSFTITTKGERSGREDFRIRSTPGANGPEMVATATVSYADRRVLPQMRADQNGVPAQYVVEVKNGPTVDERVTGLVGRNRVSAHVKNARGESANEFVVSPGALVIDDDVFHQYYFLVKRSGPVSVIVPRENAQVTMRVSAAGTETVSIGGTSIEAKRFNIADPGGADREVWTDGAGRVLKVAIPSRGIVALRDDPPR
jgi:hypothetical protein